MTDGRFAGKVAVVTGAGSGIGRATAERFAAEGARAACLDVIEEAAAETASGIGDSALALDCDVADEVAVSASVEAVVEWAGRIDVLANVAGVGGSVRFEDLTRDEWDRTLGVNLTGTFLMCRATVPHLEQSSGSIVNVASVAGVKGIAFAAAYAAAKGGVVALSRSLAVELSDRNIRVRCLCPAGVDTPMVDRFRLPEGATVPERAKRERSPLVPPADIAEAILDLAAGQAVEGDPTVVVMDAAPPVE